MDPASPPHDPMLDATLREMADIAMPPPVSMMPATWGWAVLAALIALAIAFVLWRWLWHRAQNRYRREALGELSRLEGALGNADGLQQALAGLPALVKRTALAVFPRERVAALSGPAWADFLKAHAGTARVDEDAYRFLAETEYRLPAAAEADDAAARRTFAAARQWIEGHDVHA